MARWAREWLTRDLEASCQRIVAPTLVVTGEPSLDHVVPVRNTREYLRLIPDAEYAMLQDTGHIGLLLRPERFAEIVTGFIRRPAERGPATD
jgi:pimeloyl-ACP methyl ester carboxylesterase